MIKIVISVILILIFIAGSKCHSSEEPGPPRESNTCSDGSEYQTCGPMCQKTCDPALLFCKIASTNVTCLPGCVCKEGLVLHQPSGTCVKSSDCNTTCAKNMEYKKCGTACPATCKTPNVTKCDKSCRKGCFCTKNLVLDLESNTCIPPNKCKPQCPDNMVYKDCGPVFPMTCFPMPYSHMYSKECVARCFCKDGYLLNNGTCIKVENCPKSNCPPDMELKECVKECPPTCRYRSMKENCFQYCVKGCVCKKGHVYDKGIDKCVNINQCSECPDNMKFVNCTNTCPATCKNRKPKSVCQQNCEKGCQCLNGTLWNAATQKCVLSDDCPKACSDCPKWVLGHV